MVLEAFAKLSAEDIWIQHTEGLSSWELGILIVNCSYLYDPEVHRLVGSDC